MLVVGVRLLAISVVVNWIDVIVYYYWWVDGRLVGRISGWVGWLGIGARTVDASWLIVDPSTSSGSIHNPVLVSLLLIIKTCPLLRTVQLIFVNVTSHPALHSRTADSGEYAACPGTICLKRDFAGSWWSASVQVWVDYTWASLGSFTRSGSSL